MCLCVCVNSIYRYILQKYIQAYMSCLNLVNTITLFEISFCYAAGLFSYHFIYIFQYLFFLVICPFDTSLKSLTSCR